MIFSDEDLFRLNFRIRKEEVSILYFVLEKRIVVIIVAIKMSDYFIHKQVAIAKVNIDPLLNQMKKMVMFTIPTKR